VARGRLITIEGIDGAGKTTLAGALAHELTARSPERRVELLREPGGVEAAERIRALVKDHALHFVSRAEALLYAAARAQLIEERIGPLLAEDAIVLLDRFVDSSLAYQGGGRGLGVESVRAVNRFATGSIVPDRTLLLRITPAEGRLRRQTRPEEIDRMETEDERFYAAIAATYEELARAEPQRIRVLDGVQAPERVVADALVAVSDLSL
jgi:dTMP kinase